MSASLLSSIGNIGNDDDDKKENTLFRNFQNYNYLLGSAQNGNTLSGLTSSNASLLGSRFQTMYDNE